ncbi:hypothetical protein X726_14850 [Mesorhizobium sp. L103C105A0]|nr:hypothetical protein X726_14850 [Mesorhizobium sp. L103C105A0]
MLRVLEDVVLHCDDRTGSEDNSFFDCRESLSGLTSEGFAIALREAAMVATPIDIAQAATTATLLMRLRQRHRDDVARGWEDADPSTVAVSRAPECQWRDLAKALVHDWFELIETGLVDWIVSK